MTQKQKTLLSYYQESKTNMALYKLAWNGILGMIKIRLWKLLLVVFMISL